MKSKYVVILFNKKIGSCFCLDFWLEFILYSGLAMGLRGTEERSTLPITLHSIHSKIVITSYICSFNSIPIHA